MRELLERWAKVEPERCHATTAGMFDIRCRAQEVIAVVGNLTSARPLGGPWLLAAVIEAIEARGWTWALNGRAGGCIGYAYTGDNFQGHADSPAAALLSAYLSAIEASQ